MKKTEELSPEITDEEITLFEQAAEVLANKYNVPKVHIYIGLGENNERIVGYLKEPTYIQKLMAMDKFNSIGAIMAGEELREALTLKGEMESDERTYSKSNACDKYRAGMATTCIGFIDVAANAYKKK